MNRNYHIKEQLRQSIWMLMAVFCVLFTGAIKKGIQFRADHDATGKTALKRDAQLIRTGYREKHEQQTLVVTQKKHKATPAFIHPELPQYYSFQQPPVNYPPSHNTRATVIPVYDQVPVYLQYRNIRV